MKRNIIAVEISQKAPPMHALEITIFSKNPVQVIKRQTASSRFSKIQQKKKKLDQIREFKTSRQKGFSADFYTIKPGNK